MSGQKKSFRKIFTLLFVLLPGIALAANSVELELATSTNAFATIQNAANKASVANSDRVLENSSNPARIGKSWAGICGSHDQPNILFNAIITASETTRYRRVESTNISIRQQDKASHFRKIDRGWITSPFGQEWVAWARQVQNQFRIESESPLVVFYKKGTSDQATMNFTADENYLYLSEYKTNPNLITRTCVFALKGY